jgi:hypothetical protein
MLRAKVCPSSGAQFANLPDRQRVKTAVYLHCIRRRSRTRSECTGVCVCVCVFASTLMQLLPAVQYSCVKFSSLLYSTHCCLYCYVTPIGYYIGALKCYDRWQRSSNCDMLRSVGECGKYISATVASPFVTYGSYYVSEKIQLLSMRWLSMMKCDKDRGRIAPCFLNLGTKRAVSDQLHAQDPYCLYKLVGGWWASESVWVYCT